MKREYSIYPSIYTHRELLDTMDKEIPIPERDTNKPFLLSIEGTYHIGVSNHNDIHDREEEQSQQELWIQVR